MSEVEQEVGPYDPYQHAQALEEENKSLRESIADLKWALEEIGNKEWVQGSSVKLICTKTLERLKARGHWVEENK